MAQNFNVFYVLGIAIYGVLCFYFMFVIDSPSYELSQALADGFPTDSTSFGHVQQLALQLKELQSQLESDEHYINFAFNMALSLQHILPISGLFFRVSNSKLPCTLTN